MSLYAYAEYYYSGVDWLNEIPSTWSKTKISRVSRSGMGQTLLKEELEEVAGFSSVPVFSASEEKEAFGYFTAPAVRLETGDLIVGARGSIGKTRLVSESSTCTQTTIWVKPEKSLISSLFLYWSFVGGRESLFPFDKTAIPMLTVEQLRQGWIALPTMKEQDNIANFLGHETARIDALIEDQLHLIVLLKETRQAVISLAVTKGHDPTVAMKDSGVEWLGKVPAHWSTCVLRRVIRAVEQGWSPECEALPADEDSWGVLKAGCVNRGVFDPLENKTLPSSLNPLLDYEVRAGDILMSRASGSPELVGSTALLHEVRPRLMLSDKIFRIHLEENVSSAFFVWAMKAQFMRSQIVQALSGGNGLANNLPQSSLLTFWLAVPPLNEQDAIVEKIDNQIGKIDALIDESDAAIELLQERRSTLISAAVTGKIDVRGWKPPASAEVQELEEETM